MTPQQRMQLGMHLRQQGSQYGLPMQDIDQDGRDDRYQDPSYLAQVTTRLDQQQPGILGQLLGGGGGGMGGGGMGGGMLESPIGKAALGGIAAMAVKRMMGGWARGMGTARRRRLAVAAAADVRRGWW